MKVLSIDFNIVMYPCIKLYRRFCNEEENPTLNWEYIQNEIEAEQFLCYDGELLKSLSKLIKRNEQNGAKLYLISYHKDVISELAGESTDKIELTNVDWFHDIAMGTDDLNSIQNFKTFNSSNWVGYLQIQNLLFNYIWVKARNSDPCPKEAVDKLQLPYEEMYIKNIKDLPSDYDKIFFCFSPNMVPYKYKHLYELIGGI